MARTALLGAVLLLAAIAGCTSGGEEDPGTASPTPTGSGTLADRACPTGSVLTYISFGSPFVSDNCTGCHSSALPAGTPRQNAPIDVNFDTVDDVRAWKDRIYLRAADGYATMPPAGGPSVTDRWRLGDWLACGAP